LKHVKSDLKNSILLPAYIGITDREGSGVLDPIDDLKIRCGFYPIDKALSALPNELYKLIESEKYSVLLIIHYFGFCQNDMEKIIKLCKKHHVLVIEDCAHTLNSQIAMGSLGALGDFAFHSVHKILSCEDGGMLRVNNKKYQHILKNNVTIEQPSASMLNTVVYADLDAIKEKRRNNYVYLVQLLAGVEGIELIYRCLPPGITPHNLPIIIKNSLREKIYFYLVNKGIPAIALYYRLVKEISEQNYPESYFIANNILNLPIHQDVTFDDLDLVAQTLIEALDVYQ